MAPPLLEAYAGEMAAILAEENLRAVDTIVFAAPAQSEREVERRVALLERWQDTARGVTREYEVDEQGRRILRDFQSVRGWFDQMAALAAR